MNVHRLAESALVWAPAKVNLFFEVLAKRSDGFHEIETLMVPIGLYDTLVSSPTPSGRVRVDCRWAGPATRMPRWASCPRGADNLATQAVQMLLRRRAGVGRRHHGRADQAHSVGCRAGRRVERCRGGFAGRQCGLESWLDPRSIGGPCRRAGQRCAIFLGTGCGRLSRAGRTHRTGAGYRRDSFRRGPTSRGIADGQSLCPLPRGDDPRPVGAPGRSPARAATRGTWQAFAPQPAGGSSRAAVSVDRTLAEARSLPRLDCLAAQMSGSGTSYFGICRHARHARRVAERLRSRGVGHVYAVAASN